MSVDFIKQERMNMKRLLIVLIPLFLAVSGTTAWAGEREELEIINGEDWADSSLEQKRAFLFGVGNMLKLEQAMAGDKYESMRGRSLIPVLLEGLSGVSIADIVTQLDKFYTNHPDQSTRAVIEVLYLEMALPNL
jgi:hypothetical protein